jgi:hypothetical protein
MIIILAKLLRFYFLEIYVFEISIPFFRTYQRSEMFLIYMFLNFYTFQLLLFLQILVFIILKTIHIFETIENILNIIYL